jgi:NAD(P)-dependent dehydrogenase (short-subunit alcohol dehydrogenase family)
MRVDATTSAVVTGAAQGVGLIMATALASRGALVTVCDRKESVREVARRLGPHVAGVVADVTAIEDASGVIERATAHGGGIDVLVNCAGVAPSVGLDRPVGDALAAFDEAVAVNLRAPFLFGRAVLPGMRACRRGHIVNVGTDHVHNCMWPIRHAHDETSGACPWTRRDWILGIPDLDIYDMTKWGLNALTTDWANLLSADGVQVNTFALGMVDTPSLREYFAQAGLEIPGTPLTAELIGRVLIELLEETPGRSGDFVGLWCGHGGTLPPPQPFATRMT